MSADRLVVRLLPAFVAAWAILGTQNVRLGSVYVPPISPWWVVAAVAFATLLAPRRNALPGAERRSILVCFSLAASLAMLLLVRSAALNPALELVIRFDDGREVRSSSLQLGERRELRRLAGQRRNIVFETGGWLQIPKTGEHRFELYCDDFCELMVGSRHVQARGARSETIQLSRGEVPFSLRYRQKGGPAALRLSWDRPGFFELLPIEYFVRGRGVPPRDPTASHLALAALLAWSGALAISFGHVVRFARSRALPVATIALVVAYGSVIRFESFLARSGLARSDTRAAVLHERLLPLMPPYAVFNPENAPADPYRADVRSYLDGAETMTLSRFYRPSFREPFYVALVKAFVALSGAEVGILIESLVFSIATLLLLAVISSKLFGVHWTAALLVPVAIHEWLVLESATGYRMSAYGFFLVAFVGWSCLSLQSRALASVGTGVLASLLCLIRISALSVVIPVVALRLLQLGRNERKFYAGVVAGSLVVLVGPFLLSNTLAHGDPFYSISFHTEFWLRAEGLDRGQGPVSWLRYFTGFGRIPEIAKGTVAGLTFLPLRTFSIGLRQFPLIGAITVVCGVLGLAMAFRSRPLLPVAYLGHLVPFAYVQNFPSGTMPRFVMPAFFFFVVAAPLGAERLLSWVSRLRGSRDRPPYSSDGKRSGGEKGAPGSQDVAS
ncbi:MAG TPA: hypothetical protein VEK15_02900 [Vicinamibacteria bacterium]|nr:hypothetical protein [Vicinamibacteria bacterium]